MSTQNPGGGSRRRRIAGERKPGTTQATRPSVTEAHEPVATAEPAEPTQAMEPSAEPSEARRTPEPEGTDEARKDARPGHAVPTRALVALGVIAALLVAFAASGFGLDGVGIQAWRESREQQAVADAHRAAPAAAERAAAAILAYDHETLEADRDNAARFMTEDYRKEYTDTFGLVLDNAPRLEAVVKAEVRASGVTHADPDRVGVLLFVNQTTTSKANNGEPQTALNRVVMTMQRSGDTWLVDGITSY